MNKSFVTNLISILIIIAGYLSPVFGEQLKSMGLFAFSGALTNWIAVHMLFEKIPFFYGSGVVTLRFEDFKKGIHKLVMEQFFTRENIEKFVDSQGKENQLIDKDKVINMINLDKVFNDLVRVIMESNFGGMLAMFGGEQALIPLKQPFVEKMEGTVHDVIHSPEFSEALTAGDAGIGSTISKKVAVIVEKRLDELTPQMVKEIIQDMIRKHLGWLVVWGGVFGALIGLFMNILL